MPDLDLPASSHANFPEPEKLYEYMASAQQSVWSQGDVCTFKDGSTWTFPYTAFKRERHNKTGEQYRMEFWGGLTPKQGNQSEMREILYTLTGTKYKSAGDKAKHKLVKIGRFFPECVESIYHEYAMLRKAGHISVKPPVDEIRGGQKRYFLVMEKKPGVNLSTLLSADRKNAFQNLTIIERIQLSCSLLKALKAQAHDQNIFHGDIKPRNIMVESRDDLEELFIVNLVDYGSAKDADIPGTAAPFTCIFAAPEVLCQEEYGADGELTTINPAKPADIYASGRTLAEIFGEDRYFEYDPSPGASQFNEMGKKTFPDAPWFTPIAERIEQTLHKMLHCDRHARPDIETLIDAFGCILADVKNLTAQHAAVEGSSVSERKRTDWHESGSRYGFYSAPEQEKSEPIKNENTAASSVGTMAPQD